MRRNHMRVEELFEDQHSGKKLFYFKGRNTPIVARTADEARKKMKRGGKELVKVRTPTETEMRQIRNDKWVTTRVDGKSKEKSSYGKGRGYGPPRKNKET